MGLKRLVILRYNFDIVITCEMDVDLDTDITSARRREGTAVGRRVNPLGAGLM